VRAAFLLVPSLVHPMDFLALASTNMPLTETDTAVAVEMATPASGVGGGGSLERWWPTDALRKREPFRRPWCVTRAVSARMMIYSHKSSASDPRFPLTTQSGR